MNVFLVFSEFPIWTDMYYIRDVEEEDLVRLKNCHGHLLNVDENAGYQKDLEWLFDEYLERKQVKNSSITKIGTFTAADTIVVFTGMLI